MTAERKRIALAGVLAAWAVAAIGGMGLLMASSRVPDAPADARPGWPAGLALDRRPGRPTLVVCLHPRCPCSDATLDALEQLLDTNADANAIVLFAMPAVVPPEWSDTPMIVRARGTRGLSVVLDSGGVACARLGARSSGQTFLYDADDRLAFVGGLTPGRGETGATPGAALIARILAGDPPAAAPLRTDVFGCALYRTSVQSPTTKAVP